MAKQRRKEHLGLPTNWRFDHGAYRYRVPKGQESHWDGKKEFKLGRSLDVAYRTWAERITAMNAQDSSGTADDIRTIADLLDKYLREVVPLKKSATTRDNNKLHIPRLREVLGPMHINQIRPKHIYKYVALRSVKKINPKTGRKVGGKIIAHREIETLAHAFTKAVEWGLLDRHPFQREVRLEGEPSRTRYVDDWEVIEMLALQSRRKKGSVLAVQAYLRLKLLTGMAQGDLLRLTESQLKPDGIHVVRHKTANSTGKLTIYEWSPQLKAAVAMAKAARPKDIAVFLFCTRDGKGYVNEETGKASGWKSMWQRFSARVVSETDVTEHFTEHDLRAKVGSDAETLEHARQLLAHADARTTQRVYRRRPERVRPAG